MPDVVGESASDLCTHSTRGGADSTWTAPPTERYQRPGHEPGEEPRPRLHHSYTAGDLDGSIAIVLRQQGVLFALFAGELDPSRA
jgi:hypothetical protein